MRQQINLFPSLPKRPIYDLSAIKIAKISGVFILLLLFVSVYQSIRNALSNHELRQLQASQEDASKTLSELATKYPVASKEADLRRETQAITQQLTEKKQVLQTLIVPEQQAKQNSFSNYLVGLASAANPYISLKTILLGEHGAQASLFGTAMTADEVVRFTERLQKQSSFAGKHFKTFRLIEPKAATQQINFVLSTNAGVVNPPPTPAQVVTEPVSTPDNNGNATHESE
jgi:hypothetical protein